MARKMTQTITILAAMMLVLALSSVPAFASSEGSNGKGDEKKAEQAQDDPKGNSDKNESEETTSETSDHDGDADSDSGTTMEDSHADEPDATPSDNQHPSGKDRSGESGGSGNQGKAESNPDDSKGPMRYEGGLGDDKPGGPGGTDLADQDGNNGCGNDDDFDDDNNGHCGKPVEDDEDEDEVIGEVITGPCDKDGDMANGVQACDSAIQPSRPKNEVLADVITNPGTPEVDSPEVAAERASTLPAAVLPFTGGSVLPLLAVALGLIATGTMIARARKTEK